MRKFGLLVLVAACAAFAIYALPGRIQLWKAAKADYAIAAKRVAAIVPGGPQVLDFSDLDHLSDLPPEIATRSDLIHINLSNTEVSDIGALASLKKLSYLSMNNVPVQDLSPLAGLRELKNLSISKTWAFDLAPIVGLSKLEQLNLSYTAVKSLEPVLQVRGIRQLTLFRSYAHDGSNEHYEQLVRALPRVNNGSAYKQNYKPGWKYRMNVSYQRFKRSWMIDRPAST